MKRFPGQAARLVAVLCLLPVVVLGGLLINELVIRISRMAEVRAEIEPKYARLRGILERGEDINTARGAAIEWLAARTYPADADVGEIGTELQQRVRQLAEAAEVRVTGSQILPVRNETGFVVITVTGNLEGQTGALAAFLAALAAEEPPIAVERLAIQSPRARVGQQIVDAGAQISMNALKLVH